VVKLEPLGGDPLRVMPPVLPCGESGVFAWLNTNKRSVTDTPEARAALLEGADMLLDTRPPNEIHGEHDRLRAAHPSLAITAISWFGETGPYRDFAVTEAIVRALAGLVALTGRAEGPPTLATDGQAGIVAGIAAFIASAAGLYGRGDGVRRFSVSVHEAMVNIGEYESAIAWDAGASRKRPGINLFGRNYPVGIYPTKQGMIGLTIVTPLQWRSFCEVLGIPEAAKNPRYAVSMERLKASQEIDALIQPVLATRTAEQWFALGLEHKLPMAVVPTMAELLRQPVHRERGVFVPVRIGDTEFEAQVLPQRLEGTPPKAGGRAPLAGEHTAEWLAPPARPAVTTAPAPAPAVTTPARNPVMAGLDPAISRSDAPAVNRPNEDGQVRPHTHHDGPGVEPNKLYPSGPDVSRPPSPSHWDHEGRGTAAGARMAMTVEGNPSPAAGYPDALGVRAGHRDGGLTAPAPALPNLPLHGLRIIDLTMGWAGPTGARHLADLGAEIIKVEACQYPDWWRGTDLRAEFIAEQRYEKIPWFQLMNRNKLGVTLDLTHPEGVALLKRLVAGAHAVIENYSSAVLRNLKLDYSVLKDVRPGLVMLSMPAFGSNNAWSACRAYGSTLEQGSGLPAITGWPDDPPTMNHTAYGDPVGGFNASAALMVALLHQQRTGQGQNIDLSQVECMMTLAAPSLIEQSASGRTSPRIGNRHRLFVPHGAFRCAGEDDWVTLSITSDPTWRALCALIGREDLSALDTAARRQRQDELEAAISAWTAGRGAVSAMEALQEAGVAAGAAMVPITLDRDPHLIARGFWRRIDRPFIGPHWQSSAAFREGPDAYPIRHPAPTLGEHNDAVLGGMLGLSEVERERLAAAGITGTIPKPRRPSSG
jgi:crotonobetainyl-CoA:carnitine CoA-transferase CaiB-like acyl-CoA transferase